MMAMGVRSLLLCSCSGCCIILAWAVAACHVIFLCISEWLEVVCCAVGVELKCGTHVFIIIAVAVKKHYLRPLLKNNQNCLLGGMYLEH
jgi:hypothetical protein